jgi:hypothetical protein
MSVIYDSYRRRGGRNHHHINERERTLLSMILEILRKRGSVPTESLQNLLRDALHKFKRDLSVPEFNFTVDMMRRYNLVKTHIEETEEAAEEALALTNKGFIVAVDEGSDEIW